MKLDLFIKKLAKWALILNDMIMILFIRLVKVNQNVDCLSQNPSYNEENIMNVHQHGDANLEVVLGLTCLHICMCLVRCFGDAPQIDTSTRDSCVVNTKLEGDGELQIYIMMHQSLHICRHAKFRLDQNLRNKTTLCIQG